MLKKSKVESKEIIFENRILRIDQVAEMLGFSKSHIYVLVKQKELPSYKKGKTLFFMSEEIFDWIKEESA